MLPVSWQGPFCSTWIEIMSKQEVLPVLADLALSAQVYRWTGRPRDFPLQTLRHRGLLLKALEVRDL
jgi:hypothetical protein